MALSRQLNGERAVVFIYIVRILSSIPLSLVPEGFALCVEISADDASNPLSIFFRTRPGVSSGVLLGAVTLPGLLLSKLVQTLRENSLQQVGVKEFEYLKSQYWAASSSCVAVLIFLSLIGQCPGKSNSSICSPSRRNQIYSSICVIFFVGSGLASLSGKLYGGLSPVLISLWVLGHGWASIALIQKILETFPACASIGESLLVTTGIVIYFGDMLAYTASKISYLVSLKALFTQNGINRGEISTIIQGMIFGLLLFSVFYKYILRMGEYCVSSRNNTDLETHEKRRSLVFYALLTFLLVAVVPAWMQFVHTFNMHPFFWVIHFVLSEPLNRLALCVYWLVTISVSVRRFYSISKNSKTERILLRKYYHLMAVALFVPALIFQPKFLDLSFGAALAVFLLLEIIRIRKIWPLGHLVHQFMNAFTDHRDSDLLIVSHFSLLLGCAIPIWLSSGFTDRPLAPFAGILSLGIGDTMASMVGHKYGVLRWSKTGKKTIEGTAAGITSVLAACFVLLPLLAATGYIFTMHWFSLIVAVTTSGLLEAYTAQLDNAFIPLVFYSILCL
ncbi:LOW QUALITY PROTEIN: dolichol kinase EVAN-like [Salvia hispanica]|uniref:LOW QUALITY PROTEIN: dolichol kinase EVAN-like n=1 Tax=Salvia hispanica TaxID=49212 RepID=UPI0020093B3B|nr:LOW QUALITY PROTEIN: dolichol kinase EVAN-like [Salvia hispanica]